jgi:hypothetical protein
VLQLGHEEARGEWRRGRPGVRKRAGKGARRLPGTLLVLPSLRTSTSSLFVTHVDLLCRFFCVITLHANAMLGSQESHRFLQSVLLIPGPRAKEAEDVVLGRLASGTGWQPGEKFVPGQCFRWGGERLATLGRSQTGGVLANPGHHHRESKPRLGAAIVAMLCRAMGWTGEAPTDG